MPLSSSVIAELERILGRDGLVRSPEGRLVYECDMHTFYKGAQDVVALPDRTEQVQAIVGLCRRERIPVVPRGSGTGLIGGGGGPAGGGEQLEGMVGLCHRERIPVVPRGSGTGLIGGAMAPSGGVMVGMNRMTRILEVDLPNRCATVEPGLINLWLTKAVEGRGYFFAPDPSS